METSTLWIFAVGLAGGSIVCALSAAVLGDRARRSLARWRARRRSAHAVILGDTELAAAIATQQRLLRRVTCVGLPALNGCLALPAANVPAKDLDVVAADAAELIFIDFESDIATLSLLQELERRQTTAATRPRIVAHVRDASVRRAVVERIEATGGTSTTLFGLGSVIARDAIRKQQLFDRAYWRDQRCVHTVIIGFTPIGRACMEEAIFAGIAGQLKPPRVTLLVAEPLVVRDILSREMPEINESAEIAIEAFHSTSFSDAALGPLVQADNAASITAIFICLQDEATAVTTMNAIAILQQRTGRALGPVYVLSEKFMGAAQIARPLDRPKDDARRFVVTSGVPDDADLLDLLTARGDVTAQRLHEAYQRKFETGVTSRTDWLRLPETYRAANRRAAQHLPQKLWTAGLTLLGTSPDTAAVQSSAYETVVKPSSLSQSEDALLRRLARLEHDRWNADRRVDGWTYGPTRDNGRRLHPNLMPFDDPRLTDADIAKDIQQIQFLLGEVVTKSSAGATVPVCVGVIGGESEAAGVDPGAVLVLLAKETWRPVVIVSGLLDDAQCRIVSDLAAELDRSGRPNQLVIPEIRPDNRGLRTIGQPSVLAALVDRPSTRIVPIGAPEQPGDEWADPESPAHHLDLINRYIAKRATAIINADARADI